jgi:hypothetical protein
MSRRQQCSRTSSTSMRAPVIQAEVVGGVRHPLPPELGAHAAGGFVLDLGSVASIGDSVYRYVIRDLPPNCALCIGFCRLEDGQQLKYRRASAQLTLGIEEWWLEWKVEGETRVYTVEKSGADADPVLIQDAAMPQRWLTVAGAVYELTVSAVMQGQSGLGGRRENGIRLVVAGVPSTKTAPKQDSRPARGHVVDHGSFSHTDLRVNPLQWKTPSGKYRFDLGEAVVEKGVTHRYQISGLPSGIVFHIGFAVSSPDPAAAYRHEFLQQTGVRRIHVHLATAQGVVLISEELDTRESFAVTVPYDDADFPRVNGFVAEGSRNDWAFGVNTASGTAFVPEKGATYTLEFTIIEVEHAGHRSLPLRPVIRS